MWKKIGRAATEMFFPAECFFCKKPKTFLCDDCVGLLDLAQHHRPDRANKYLDDVYAAGSYDNKHLKRLVAAFKYGPFLRSLGSPLAGLIARHFLLAEIRPELTAIIVPVPLAKKRLRWRGYNQAQILARELGTIWRLPVHGDVLARARETKNQAELTGMERRNNIKDAFTCPNPSGIENKTVYLIDDVFTTGATMDECAKLLKRHGAAIVVGLALARTEN
jgi:ComF family protein